MAHLCNITGPNVDIQFKVVSNYLIDHKIICRLRGLSVFVNMKREMENKWDLNYAIEFVWQTLVKAVFLFRLKAVRLSNLG